MEFQLSSEYTLSYEPRGKGLNKIQEEIISLLDFDGLTLSYLMWNDTWEFKQDEKPIYDLARNTFVVPSEACFNIYSKFNGEYGKNSWYTLRSSYISNSLETMINRETEQDRYTIVRDFLIKYYHVLTRISLKNLKKFVIGRNFLELKTVQLSRVIFFSPDTRWLCIFSFSPPLHQFTGTFEKIERIIYSENFYNSNFIKLKIEKDLYDLVNKLKASFQKSDEFICLFEFNSLFGLNFFDSDEIVNRFILKHLKNKGWDGGANLNLKSLKSSSKEVFIPADPEFDVLAFKEDKLVLIETKRRKYISENERNNVMKFYSFFTIVKGLLPDFVVHGIFLSTGNFNRCFGISIYDPNFHITSPDQCEEILKQLMA